MKSSMTIGLMADESTSVSITKELVLYGRVVVDGKINSYYLKMVKLDDGKANTIVAAISDYLIFLYLMFPVLVVMEQQ